jgi:SAM-dependent methyltransferase
MQPGALAPYEHALRTRGPLSMRTTDGRLIELDVARFLAETNDADDTVVDRCRGPVLDVGCGPGRFVSELRSRGLPVLGVDIAGGAVALARADGLPVLLRNVFGELPGEGSWPTVLLLDGNIGIGGNPIRLLNRVASLLAVGGRLIVETQPDADADELVQVRFNGSPGPVFGWAIVGMLALFRDAAAAGYEVDEVWSSDGRSFAALVRSRTTLNT